MPRTVNASFSEFNEDYVNLLPSRTTTARTSRDWLYTQLNLLKEKESTLPKKYEERNVNYGSFARRTKIRELDDIDLMPCFSGDGAYYSIGASGTYLIHTENSSNELKALSENDILNSNRFKNKLKSALAQVETYSKAELHSHGEAVTLSLQSYEWVFDIVPCFYTTTGFYLIPDGQGNWKATDPRKDQEYTELVNQNRNGQILQLIRTLKFWNRRNSTHTIPSYMFEVMVLRYFESRSVNASFGINIHNFFHHLQTAIYVPVEDPKGFDGDLNPFGLEEMEAISEKARWAYEKAVEAVNAEHVELDHSKAMQKWKEIFGYNFPQYG